MQKIFFFLLNLLLLTNLTACIKEVRGISALNIDVRVLIKHDQEFAVKPDSRYIFETQDKSIITSGNMLLAYHNDGITVNGRLLETDKITVKGLRSFEVNGDHYRGSFVILREDGRLSMINYINIEEYLFSVVPKEIYPSWSYETLKAQTIASRTYALYQVRNKDRSKTDFDLYSDTRSQVYLGTKVENHRVSKIVSETAGQVITYNGSLIKSYFHSSSGGSLSSGSEILDPSPYLAGKPSYIQEKDPSKQWSIELELETIKNEYGLMGDIVLFEVATKFSSGRIDKIKIQDSTGHIALIDGYKLRQFLGQTKMKSTLAKISPIKDGTVTIVGTGYGHGVGMGQWDAEAMALQGCNYEAILGFFYQDVQINTIY
ncbi:stage II sporulation protein D [Brevinema andersonii]|uniref:Stage II sporulation protein D n=1 Tax=Brevinema andersonii TaxID=34097 RepID=A0A1I1DL70_BREAD|nr:SpoIID/LytB domain-containing protein [Brevinema andersonii]SFB75166.1 stage II sporulation protein D [Brevinema andersonii]